MHRSTFRRLPAPLALMGVIFLFSAQPDLGTGLGNIDLVLRKMAHMVEFGALCALWAWALAPSAGVRAALVAAMAISVTYAVSDEVHQTTVRGRMGSPIDVGIDTVGVVVAALAIRYRHTRGGLSTRPRSE
ncbi:MAG: VanZ family protein [Solirubrobacterales bacterium]